MLEQEENNELLARWIAGELSPEELKEFQSRAEYQTYAKIKAGADSLDLRTYDLDTALTSIKTKNQKTKPDSKPVRQLWPYIAVAASIAIILGIFLFPTAKSFTTGYGERMAVTLPDGSEIILNAKSTISFDEQNWDEHRNVDLSGEAYFKVSKGNTFTVTTKNGDVSVLGTEFNVQSYDSFFEAVCYEGKVRVTSHGNENILTAGKAFRTIATNQPEYWTLEERAPTWVSNTSSFRSVPIQFVFDALQKQYDLTIKKGNIDIQTIYTGTFPNNDKQIALKTVFSTLGFSYQLSDDGKTVVVEP